MEQTNPLVGLIVAIITIMIVGYGMALIVGGQRAARWYVGAVSRGTRRLLAGLLRGIGNLFHFLAQRVR